MFFFIFIIIFFIFLAVLFLCIGVLPTFAVALYTSHSTLFFFLLIWNLSLSKYICIHYFSICFYFYYWLAYYSSFPIFSDITICRVPLFWFKFKKIFKYCLLVCSWSPRAFNFASSGARNVVNWDRLPVESPSQGPPPQSLPNAREGHPVVFLLFLLRKKNV